MFNLLKYIKTIEEKVKRSFDKVKEELDMHRESINDNTEEIQLNYESIIELDKRIDKIEEKVERIEMILSNLMNNANITLKNENEDVPYLTKSYELNNREKEVFACLYALCEQQENVTYDLIATKLGYSKGIVIDYINRLIEKGIPIIKRYINGIPFLDIDPEFRQLQAKKNILKISKDFFKDT